MLSTPFMRSMSSPRALQQVGQPVIDLARIQRLRLLDANRAYLRIMVMRGEGALRHWRRGQCEAELRRGRAR